jgi:RNA polymerase-binding transcription factor DksA
VAEHEAIRAELETRLAELLARSEAIDAHQHERGRDVPKDWEDLAQYRENDEVVAALDDLTRDEIARLRATLGRLDAGTWGVCARCAEPIEETRLAAVPTAPICGDCARELEARR